ncbi:hypothetical protein REPUB_Repub05bG0095800 [Reevesia pubescens]
MTTDVAAPETPAQLEPVQSQYDVKLFNRWVFDEVQVGDISLSDYIGVQASKHATYVPHTARRCSVKRFRKAQCPIVERLTNSFMMHGRNNRKKLMAVRIVKHAMEIIFLLTDQNPIQVIVDAVINSGPREDATHIGFAGVVKRQAVDISHFRCVNHAIYLLTTGALVEPYSLGFLKVFYVHTIYWEQSRNPSGHPVVLLYGGPRGGTSPSNRRFFDLEFYRIILFDQRGAGKSTPHACLEENATWDIIDDIEKLREHLEIPEWKVFGGSWGSTLALAYSESHPEKGSHSRK